MANQNDVKVKMAEFLHQPVDKLKDTTVLADLVSDSMILVNLVIELQEEFGVRLVQDDLKSVNSVGELLALFERKMAE